MKPRIDEHEWQAQERALQDERTGAAIADDQPYRQVARALRQTLPHALPQDFAERVAALAMARVHAAVDTGVEQRLVHALMLVLALSAAVVAALYGQQWLQAVVALLPGVAINWALALMACVGLSWSFDMLRARTATHQRHWR